MRYIYGGHHIDINCSNFEDAYEAIDSGEYFRIDNYPYYMKKEICEARPRMPLPENTILARLVVVTERTVTRCQFYRFVQDDKKEKVKVYTGEALNQLILKELKVWVASINPKLRAFSGRSFESYLRAIPKEILMQNGFYGKMKLIVKNSFKKRLGSKNISSMKDIDQIVDMGQRTMKIMQESYDEKCEEMTKTNRLATKKLDDLKTKSSERLDDIFAERDK